MTDTPPPKEAAAPEPVAATAEPAAAEPRARRSWRRWLSAVLFLLVAACFTLPFASTSCTLPGGYGRGVQGTSTVYRGVDLAFDAVPAVNPSDRQPRPDSLPNEGQLGFQPLALLALLAAVAGISLALVLGAGPTAGYAAGTTSLLAIGEWIAVTAIAGRIGGTATLPSGKSQTDYVNTGQGFLLALVLLVVLMAVNLVAIGWQARRARSPG
jgi:uncharacterized integral membrane protein